MNVKIIHVLGVFVATLGGLVVLCAVGAADCGTYTLGQALGRIVVGIVALLIGLVIMAVTKDKED